MDDWNYNAIKVWLDIVQFLFTAAVAVYVYLSRAPSENKRAISDISDRVGAVERGHEELRVQVAHLPSKDEMNHLSNELSANTAHLEALQPQLQAMQRKIDLLLENELRGSHVAR